MKCQLPCDPACVGRRLPSRGSCCSFTASGLRSPRAPRRLRSRPPIPACPRVLRPVPGHPEGSLRTRRTPRLLQSLGLVQFSESRRPGCNPGEGTVENLTWPSRSLLERESKSSWLIIRFSLSLNGYLKGEFSPRSVRY